MCAGAQRRVAEPNRGGRRSRRAIQDRPRDLARSLCRRRRRHEQPGSTHGRHRILGQQLRGLIRARRCGYGVGPGPRRSDAVLFADGARWSSRRCRMDASASWRHSTKRRKSRESPTCRRCSMRADPAQGAAKISSVHWSSRFRLQHRVADHYRAGRLLLVGDAAHVHSPAGGQGMNTGLVDAVVLGKTLAEVISGRRDPSFWTNERLRRPAAVQVLGLAGRLTSMATLKALSAAGYATPCSRLR